MPDTTTDMPGLTIDQDATVRIVLACGFFERNGDVVTLALPQKQAEAVGDFLRLTEPLWKP